MNDEPRYTYRRDIPKTQMARYAAKWAGLPMPRLQLRWSPKPVPNSDPAFRADTALSRRIARQMGYPAPDHQAWDCFYEMILPVDQYDLRNESYSAGFIILPITWTRRTGSATNPPCSRYPTDDVFRDGAHAFWDSKALGWLPIFVVAPDGTAAMKSGYTDEPAQWLAQANAINAPAQVGTRPQGQDGEAGLVRSTSDAVGGNADAPEPSRLHTSKGI